jgi:hypothetical protein
MSFNQVPGVGSQESGVGSQELEGIGQKGEVRGQKSDKRPLRGKRLLFIANRLLIKAYFGQRQVMPLLQPINCKPESGAPPAAYCLLPTAYCLPRAAYCLLLTAYCLLQMLPSFRLTTARIPADEGGASVLV